MADIVQVPGAGQEIQQALAPLIQALQHQHMMQQRQQEQEQQIAANMFAHGLQTPGFETTEAAQQLEMKLGVPGLGKSIATARVNEKKLKLKGIDETVTKFGEAGLSAPQQAGLRASLTAQLEGAPAEVANRLYVAFAGDADLSPLDKARLDELNVSADLKIEQVSEMRRHNDPSARHQASKILGVPDSKFDPGVDYIDVLEDHLKQEGKSRTDPQGTIVNTAMTLMGQSKDLIGRFNLTAPEALQQSIQLWGSTLPATVKNVIMTPTITAQLNATNDALNTWQGLIDSPSSINPKTGKKFKNDDEIRRTIIEELKARYPILETEDAALKQMLDIVSRRVLRSR